MGIGDWGLGPIPNPQSPIPNPHLIRSIIYILKEKIYIIILIKHILLNKFDKIIN